MKEKRAHQSHSINPLELLIVSHILCILTKINYRNFILDHILSIMQTRHPGALTKIMELDSCKILIDPIDVPFLLTFTVGSRPELRVFSRKTPPTASAAIRGRLSVLLELFEGRIDGDSLFFARDLAIEGDTAAIVGLRNAMDGEAIDIATVITAFLGPISHLSPLARQILGQVNQQIADLHELFFQPLVQPMVKKINEIEKRITKLERSFTK
ncbi:putative SCP2 domain-containing protein [Azospirillaceae bacterium]